MNKLFLIILPLLIFCACGNNNSNQDVVATALDKDDAQFLALKDTAQKHLPEFIDSLQSHPPDTNYRFAVKSDFVDGDEHEHMWSVITSYHDDIFEGIFADSALVLKNIRPGQPVKISKADLEDWVIYNYKAGTETGNFSDKYLKSKL